MGIERFASRVGRAQDVAGLAACVLDETGDLAGAPARGLYLFSAHRIDIHVRNVPQRFIDVYERVGRKHDPVLAGIRRSHAPCQISFLDLQVYACDPLLPADFRAFVESAMTVAPGSHYLAAPLVVDGAIAGTLDVARYVGGRFSPKDVMTAFAMALHVSSRLAALRALGAGLDESWREALTPRGFEVAELAARGLTMVEVGRALGVSANTAKKHLRLVYERLGIATRAELARALMQPSPVSLRRSRDAPRAR